MHGSNSSVIPAGRSNSSHNEFKQSLSQIIKAFKEHNFKPFKLGWWLCSIFDCCVFTMSLMVVYFAIYIFARM